jgi:hypothetical protein
MSLTLTGIISPEGESSPFFARDFAPRREPARCQQKI